MIKSWDSKFKVNSAFHHLNDRGAKAIYNFIKQSKICQNYTGILEIQELKVHTDLSNDLSPDITNIKKLLNKLYGFVILKPIDDLNIFEQPVVSWLIDSQWVKHSVKIIMLRKKRNDSNFKLVASDNRLIYLFT